MSTVSLALRYGLRLDASEAFIQGYVDGMRLDQRGQGVACGRGWIPRSKKCSRDKATATPKEAKARTAEKARERAKLKGEVKAAKGQKPRVKEKPPEPNQDPVKLQKVVENRAGKGKSKGKGKQSTTGNERPSVLSREEFDEKLKEERKRTRQATRKATSNVPDPKPADPEKLSKFAETFQPGKMTAMTLSSNAGMEERKQFYREAMKGKKFASQEIEIVGRDGTQMVSAKTVGDLAIVPLKDINLNPNVKKTGNITGYSITHIPTGMSITGADNSKAARAIASALIESGIDWSGNPQKLPRQELEALGSFLNWARNGVKLDSSGISLAEALYG